jgi:hypothetical protein
MCRVRPERTYPKRSFASKTEATFLTAHSMLAGYVTHNGGRSLRRSGPLRHCATETLLNLNSKRVLSSTLTNLALGLPCR